MECLEQDLFKFIIKNPIISQKNDDNGVVLAPNSIPQQDVLSWMKENPSIMSGDKTILKIIQTQITNLTRLRRSTFE